MSRSSPHQGCPPSPAPHTLPRPPLPPLHTHTLLPCTDFPAPAAAIQGHTEKVTSIAFSPDGRQLATGGNDNTARVWDLSSGQNTATLQVIAAPPSLKHPLVPLPPHVNTAAVHGAPPPPLLLPSLPPDPLLAAMAHTSTATQGHTSNVNSIAFSPDGRQLATCSRDDTARVWDLGSGQNTVTLKVTPSLCLPPTDFPLNYPPCPNLNALLESLLESPTSLPPPPQAIPRPLFTATSVAQAVPPPGVGRALPCPALSHLSVQAPPPQLMMYKGPPQLLSVILPLSLPLPPHHIFILPHRCPCPPIPHTPACTDPLALLPHRGTTMGSTVSPSAPMGGSWPPAARTTRRGCGT